MSYDLYMLNPEPGVEPYEQLERLDAEEQSSAPDPAILARNRRSLMRFVKRILDTRSRS